MSKLENEYQAQLIAKIKALLPGCFILKNDTGYLQGIPDLTVLYKKSWAVLEVKRKANAKRQPNQPYYIKKLSEIGFAAFINPSNETEVLGALQQSFEAGGSSCVPQSEQIQLGELRRRKA